MLQLPCPWCGPRNDSEFRYLGEARSRPDPVTVSVEEWRTYLYERDNPCGWVTEHWFHRSGCRRFVTVERHTLSNELRPGGSITSSRPAGRDPTAQAWGSTGRPAGRDRTPPPSGGEGRGA